jgi:hypothetical protein
MARLALVLVISTIEDNSRGGKSRLGQTFGYVINFDG